MKITIIGGGVMGSAMAEALLQQQILSAENLTVTDINLSKLDKLKQKGIVVTTNNLEAVENTDVVIIAVKPQVISETLSPLRGAIPQNALVLSIAAGVSIATLQEIIGHKTVVRAMPNTPVLIQTGMSGWYASEFVRQEQKEIVKQILSSFGKEIEVKSEDQIDIITALSGSGPAYVFLFIQGLVEGAARLGLDEKQAKIAAIQTVLGGAKLAQNSDEDLKTLIENVTSKGGTTAEAQKKFTELNFQGIIAQAMEAAYDRAKELGEK